MERNNLFRLVMLSILALTGQSTMAYDNLVLLNNYTLTAYAENSYELSSVADWDALADFVAAGNNCAGKTFKMTADIGPITKPLGKQVGSNKITDRRRFAGTFEGNNKTLTVNITNQGNDWFYYNASYCAPFAYAQNVTIRNLHVTGTITTTGQFASGLVGQSGPDNDKTNGACTITNCHVSATFVGNTAGNNTNGNHGTFISIAEGPATIANCWFDGIIDGVNYFYSGGFIGMNKADGTTLTDCLFNPQSIASTVDCKQSSEFSHNIGGSSTLTRCYYTTSFSDPETAQGWKVVASMPTPVEDYDVANVVAADGNTYYRIIHNLRWQDVEEMMADLTTPSQTFNLTKSLTAGAEDAALVVKAGKTFTLNMNGFTLDRDLDRVNPASTAGYVIKVEAGASLTITNGTIQHGHNDDDGGGIYNAGELVLEDVTVTENYAKSNGAGIYNASDATLQISGNVQVTGNKKGTQANNLFLAGSSIITVDDAIAGSLIGIVKNTEGVFTSGLVSNGGTASNFQNDDSNNYFIVVDNGEAYWLTPTLFEITEGVANAESIALKEGYKANVKLAGRTLYKDGDWNTICLPFDCRTTNSPLKGDGVEARELKSASYNSETNTLSLTFQTATYLVAGKPYIIRWTNEGENLYEPTFDKVTIKSAMKNTNANNIVSFKGLYDPWTVSNDPTVLFLGTQNKLYYPGTTPRTIGVCRAYFQLNGVDASRVKAYELSFEEDDDPTSIKTYTVQSPMHDAIYTLAGQRISKMQKGINIVNGKKVVIK